MIGMLSVMNPTEYRCQAICPSSRCSCRPRRFGGELIRHKSSSVPPPTPFTFSSTHPDQWGIHKQAWRISETLTLRGSLRPYSHLVPTTAHSLSYFNTPLWPFSIICHFIYFFKNHDIVMVFWTYCSTMVLPFFLDTTMMVMKWYSWSQIIYINRVII